MPPKKSGRQPLTSEHYEKEMRSLYPAVQLLKAYCEANPEDAETLKELEKKRGSLRWYRNCWAERSKVTVYVDGREQLPNSADELGYPTEQTPQYDKKKWPYYSVGDYVAHVQGVGWYPVCRERKSLNDLYGTLMDEDHRKNLYEEFGRFSGDKRFTIFRFDLECTEDEFYNYLPQWPKQCRFCEVKRIKTEDGDYWCPRSHELFPVRDNTPDFRCHTGFKERKRYTVDVQRIRSTQHKIIMQCQELGMQIIWRGSREAAYEAYRPGVEEWLKLNYVELLKLDEAPYNDRVAIENKIAECEVNLFALRASLARIEKTPEEVEA